MTSRERAKIGLNKSEQADDLERQKMNNEYWNEVDKNSDNYNSSNTFNENVGDLLSQYDQQNKKKAI